MKQGGIQVSTRRRKEIETTPPFSIFVSRPCLSFPKPTPLHLGCVAC
jgi:hypothetical protein